MKKLLSYIIIFLPFRLKRWLLIKLYGYKIHKTARIGLAYVFPTMLEMEKGASIGHFTIAINLEKLSLAKNAIIGKFNWITGHPLKDHEPFFANCANRYPALIVKEEAAITNRHIIDCSDTITIGRFTTIAGFRSQILSHSIDIYQSCQMAFPVNIGDYCFIGTGSIILAGAQLPDRCVLGAGSVLNKKFDETDSLYAGTPAVLRKKIPVGTKYFNREIGVVY